MFKALNCDVRRGVVLSASVRCFLAWRGNVLRGRLQHGEVLYCQAKRGNLGCGVFWRCLAWLYIVRSCPVRLRDVWHGVIAALRGLALSCTVLSCPVRLCKALFAEALLWYGGVRLGGARLGELLSWRCAVWSGPDRQCGLRQAVIEAWHGIVGRSPVRLGQVRFGSAKRGKVLLGMAWCRGVELGGVFRCKARSGTVLRGRVRRYYGLVKSCRAVRGTVGRSFVLHGKALLSSCGVGQRGAVSSEVRYSAAWHGKLLRGMVLRSDVLHGIVKSGPVKHCYVRYAAALSWLGEVMFGAAGSGGVLHGFVLHGLALLWRGQVWLGTVLSSKAWCCEAWHSKVSLRSGIVKRSSVASGFARLRAAGQALAFSRWGAVLNGAARYARALLRLGQVMRRPVRFCRVKSGFAMRCIVRYATVLSWLGMVLRSCVMRCDAGLFHGNARECVT